MLKNAPSWLYLRLARRVEGLLSASFSDFSPLFFVFVTSINCWEDVGFPGHALYCERVFVSQQLHVYVSVCVCVFYIIYKLIYKLLGMNVFFIYKCVSKCVCVCMYCVCLCS